MRLKRNPISITKLAFLLLICTTALLIFYIYILNDENRSSQQSFEQKVDWHNYTQISLELEKQGPGEQGTGVILTPTETEKREKVFNVNGFNGLVSDKIALNRSLKDIRHPDCKKQLYQTLLPSVSIVIPFYEEHWSTLLRTFISSINRAPPGLIKEVILVDDGSTKTFLKDDLDHYLANNYNGLVRVIRNPSRVGLIRSKINGAKDATGDVLIFLDSHCEANINWLPPLLDPIASDYRTVVCPFIDILDFETFEYRAQDEGARGAFDWEFNYKRLPLLPEDLLHPARPFKSPVMAGGLFAISRKWFWELGGYDPGLDIWGGEQYELSFKIWQCGGQMVDAPCSRIGHVYRKYPPFGSPPNLGNYIPRNYKRVAEVWMDEYKEFLYQRSLVLTKENPRNLSTQFTLRKRLNCKSFKWFMTEIAFDLEKFYPSVELPNSLDGEIRSNVINMNGYALCLEGKTKESKLFLEPCAKDDKKQTVQQCFLLTWREDIRLRYSDDCLDVSSHFEKAPVIIYKCHGQKGNQYWKYLIETQQLCHVNTKKCLTADKDTYEVYMETCKGLYNQRWTLENLNKEMINKYNKNFHI